MLPIFYYWCGKVDHDERDCLQWICSKETLRAEDKQFGAWLCAAPERIQRPQTVIASIRRSVGRADPTSEVNAGEDCPDTLRLYEEEEIPRNSDFTSFEEQLCEINAAIFETATNREESPFTNPSSDFGESMEQILEVSKLTEKENKVERQKEVRVGPSTKVDLVLMDLDLKALQKVVLEEDPTLVFLIETKFVVLEMEDIKSKLDWQQGLVVPSIRRGGGLALLWRSSKKVDVQTYSPCQIDAIVTEENGNKTWRFTGFYGHPKTSKREESWSLLAELGKRSNLPWLCIGDFNEILHLGEKVGGNLRPEGQMRSFMETINCCNLRNMGYIGSDFTWSRRLGARGWVRERLDRALVSSTWLIMFPGMKLHHVAASTSDHCMLVLKVPQTRRRASRRSKMFRFESMWLKDEHCDEVVVEAWEKGKSMGTQHPFSQCIDECKRSLLAWNKNTFGHVGKKIAAFQKKLQWLEERRDGQVNMEEVEETRVELNRMLTVLDFLNHGAAPPKFHEAHIVLIPKTKNLERVTDYRSINLCNVAYKLASKAVANRLKLVLQDIICENQSAFISERLITDNVLVAHELMNHINRKKKGKCGEMALKLEMSKAYNRVEWGCLKQIMGKLGFHEDWIRLVMRCVSSITYAVRVNGHACGQIVHTRGLRQGDPLSPYLFLICAEGLSALLHKAVRHKELKGVAASARELRISHLFFADDSLIFGRATVKECTEIQRILQLYEESSGQQLNRNKTSLFFSHNTTNGIRDSIKAMFGAQVIKPHESYLGVPSLVGRSKRNTFAQLKQRVSNKLARWKEKLISSARKEVLIKAVAQAVPSYTMSCFKLPNTLCDELIGMVRPFWWGQVKDEKKLAWMSWKKMCLLKEKKGMGFRDLKMFNLALLAKQGWRLQTNSSSLFNHVYKAKYFTRCNFIKVNLGSQPSFVWRSLWATQEVVKRGIRWHVGDGEKIQIWKDKWLQNPSTYRVVTPECTSLQGGRVCDLIDGDRMEWKEGLIRQNFLPRGGRRVLVYSLD
ncbi:uncharacterized protein LOC142644284 [Castanea sativa]|uniref:uncharacterized protein LOC142644284 n=1 Tax=Castanea sativa TaxID=21020 RepID=UPI003F6499BF